MVSPRWAAFHFAAIGALLFALQQGLRSADPARAAWPSGGDWSEWTRASNEDEELLYREALRRGLDRGDSVIRQRLVRNMRFLSSGGVAETELAEEEVLYREALALGLDRRDRVVRRRLVERMRQTLISESPAASPSDVSLRAHLLANAERFDQPERRRIEQLFFATPERAGQALAILQQPGHSQGDGAAGIPLDPLPIPRLLPSLSQRELTARLGDDFARAVFEGQVGHWWGPVVSSYGAHLVWIHERVPARAATLGEVRRVLSMHWLADQEDAAVRVAIAELRRNSPFGSAESRERLPRPGQPEGLP